jgi:hypothetical protein
MLDSKDIMDELPEGVYVALDPRSLRGFRKAAMYMDNLNDLDIPFCLTRMKHNGPRSNMYSCLIAKRDGAEEMVNDYSPFSENFVEFLRDAAKANPKDLTCGLDLDDLQMDEMNKSLV